MSAKKTTKKNQRAQNPEVGGNVKRSSSKKLVGLNIYRAIAIFMMMAAHSIRIQENFPRIVNQREYASFFDQFLLFFIDIEPIISAMFLFIAGFSLTLSFAKISAKQQLQAWHSGILKRAGVLYGIAMIFFVAEYGWQWPDFIFSPGVLGIIAMSIALSATLLTFGFGLRGLGVTVISILLATYFLESQDLNITGLNAGAGGMFPLVVMGFIGTLFGMAYQKWTDNGLFIGLAISVVVAAFAFAADYPNVLVYKSSFTLYSTNPLEQFYQSLTFWNDSGSASLATFAFWNHSALYPLRFTVLLACGLLIAIKAIKHANYPGLGFLNALGSYGLTIYVYHLMVLAALEVTGLKPQTGWQTLLLIVAFIISGYLLIRNRLRIDPDT
ncbi:MAG: DUF1624 domain-containing protein [Pseudomonadales bacterium]|nr:DUF1624 domain-containing protein [Pseudomonadales bacterium]